MFQTYRARSDLPIPKADWRHVWCLLIPGFSFLDAGWPRLGRVILYLWFGAVFFFLACLGYPAADWAFAMMLSLHVTSVMYLINRTSPSMSMWRRLVISLVALFIVGQLLYGLTLRRAVLPILYRDEVFVVYRIPSWATIKRGEFVVFHTYGRGGQVSVQSGYIFSRVLAGPGDVVSFDESTFSVNGAPAPRLARMPCDGTLTLPEKRWLIWPELATVTKVNVPEEQIAAVVLDLAQVRRSAIIGKPFRHWFWREQTL